MSTSQANVVALEDRRAPALGGFNLTVMRIEARRVLRNRRAMLGTVVLPVAFFLLFGLNSAYASDKAGHGNVSAFIMISMALYGAVIATTSGGAMVSIERAQGWSRQLRLTPLSPIAYIVIRMLSALVLGLTSLLAVYIVGLATGKPSMPGYLWFVTGLTVWVGSLIFAAFGLFMGYLMPTENVMQVLSFVLVLLSFAAGLFVPLSQFPHLFREIAAYTPLYGLNYLVHAPLLGQGIHLSWVINAVVWLAIFAGGAAWRFRLDTKRV